MLHNSSCASSPHPTKWNSKIPPLGATEARTFNMCGITACHHVPDAKAFKPTALKMVKQCRHRGPDWSGSYMANRTSNSSPLDLVAIADAHSSCPRTSEYCWCRQWSAATYQRGREHCAGGQWRNLQPQSRPEDARDSVPLQDSFRLRSHNTIGEHH